jgi:hypothetical protein
MQKYSGTYLSAIVAVLVVILPKLGITIGSEELTSWIGTTIFLVTQIVILYKRWIGHQAPVSLLGFRK